MNRLLPSTKIFGVRITTAPKSEVLEYIFDYAKKKESKGYIVTPNPEILMYSMKHPSFKEVLNRAQVSLPDGIGVLMADRISENKIIGRITGVDFMVDLCRKASKQALTVGFFGGKGGVAERTAECLREKFPGLKVVFASDSFGVLPLRVTPHESNQLHIDILFVALGFPKQEEWIVKNLPHISVTIAMGVGGAFDYLSGSVARAPKLVRVIGMEWAFRLIRQPWRIKRQLVLPMFLIEVFKKRFLTSK